MTIFICLCMMYSVTRAVFVHEQRYELTSETPEVTSANTYYYTNTHIGGNNHFSWPLLFGTVAPGI